VNIGIHILKDWLLLNKENYGIIVPSEVCAHFFLSLEVPALIPSVPSNHFSMLKLIFLREYCSLKNFLNISAVLKNSLQEFLS
jgi:hypothetical protein